MVWTKWFIQNGLDSKEVLTMPRSCSNMDSGCRFFGVNALEDFKNNCICKEETKKDKKHEEVSVKR